MTEDDLPEDINKFLETCRVVASFSGIGSVANVWIIHAAQEIERLLSEVEVLNEELAKAKKAVKRLSLKDNIQEYYSKDWRGKGYEYLK